MDASLSGGGGGLGKAFTVSDADVADPSLIKQKQLAAEREFLSAESERNVISREGSLLLEDDIQFNVAPPAASIDGTTTSKSSSWSLDAASSESLQGITFEGHDLADLLAELEDDAPPAHAAAESAESAAVIMDDTLPRFDDDDAASDIPSSAGMGNVDDDAEEEAAAEAEAAKQARLLRAQLLRLRDAMFRDDPHFTKRSLSQLNTEAVQYQKAGDDLAAICSYAKLFHKAKAGNLTHPELHVTHYNRAGCYLSLGLYEEALFDAQRCATLAETRMRTNPMGAAAIWIKSFARKGYALNGLKRYREANIAFSEGLKADPFNDEMKRGLEESSRGVLRDLLRGRGLEMRALPSTESFNTSERITYHGYATPLHKIRHDDMLPAQLLTPFQADNDHHIKDTYNYLTVQTDIRMPRRYFSYLQDEYRQRRVCEAIQMAVRYQEEELDRDARVLNVAAGPGLHAMAALDAGARHVTCVERWLYLAMSCKEVLLTNGYTDDQVKVVYKRPTDIALLRDVPVYTNVIVAVDLLDEGLLTSGLLPAVTHALDNLAIQDPVVIPSSVTVFAQAVQIKTPECCGFDVSAVDRHRWHPSYACGVPLNTDYIVPLSEPIEAWNFDLLTPPRESERKTVDIPFTRPGVWNAVLFWYDLNLFQDKVRLSSGLVDGREVSPTLRPAVQYLAGEIRVTADRGYEADGSGRAITTMPLLCTHNTVRMRFDVERAEYMHLNRADASFPNYHFHALADTRRNEAYYRAIERAVARRKAMKPTPETSGFSPLTSGEESEVHVLDAGCGTGLLGMMAARCGADSVVGIELHESLAAVARRNVAANGLGDKVSICVRDLALAERGKEVRRRGANLVVMDFFDATLIGHQALYMVETMQRNVVQPDATYVPMAATMYVMGIEAVTDRINGKQFASFNKYRWDRDAEAVYLKDVPHRKLTKPKKVFEFFFDRRGSMRGGSMREAVLKLEVIRSGYMNGIVFWFDLHLDEESSLTTAPPGIGVGGVVFRADAGGAADKDAPMTAPAAPRDEDGVAVDEGRFLASCDARTRRRIAEAAVVSTSGDDGANHGFVPALAFGGAREGLVFRLGGYGLGYYTDVPWSVRAEARSKLIHEALGVAASKRGDDKPAADSTTSAAPPQPTAPLSAEVADVDEEHYYGQALQYLERAASVTAGKKITVLARRENNKVRFSLKEGVGTWVGKSPWRIEWGGGASIESPHYQRVHYCELLVRDFLMRLRCKRFPPIEKDMKMMLAHAGSLFLDPAVLAEVYHEFVCLELVHGTPEFSPGASLEAMTRSCLMYC
ncbi:hypothetical protein PPROV_000330100 [Pycnococcus provasolii]|uniref:Protein arginine N-methyltransferase n=1 Tax=Pycnococcus provasolii TaxID=41880 RepID=A0A830HHM5_9CHLO|nr:hypothetical protein PPROV_000330100 [Pycnococcus provasolii]